MKTHVYRAALLALLSLATCCSAGAAGTKVDFAPDGACRVDGKPFFPIGMWIYNLDADVMADLHEHGVNTVVGSGLAPTHVPLLEAHGMMCIPPPTDAWVAAAKDSRSLLAWYLIDEPEEHNADPKEVRKSYDAIKAKDKDHPVGITHDMLIGPERYQGSSDFTMTDVYPVTAKRDWPMNAVGQYTRHTREVNGKNWTNFTFVQSFGGPDTDGGKWALPHPHEVRFLAFNALVHRTNGILYFSYWPRAAITWASIADLNRDIKRLVPWLLAPGEETAITSSEATVEARAKKLEGSRWMILATNTTPKPVRMSFKVESLGDATLMMPFEAGRTRNAKAGEWTERFDAYEAKAYLVGTDPE